MTDLDAVLKIARAMRLAGAYIWREPPSKFSPVCADPRVYYVDAKDDDWHDFDPINDGADFDRVLMWARLQEHAVDAASRRRVIHAIAGGL